MNDRYTVKAHYFDASALVRLVADDADESQGGLLCATLLKCVAGIRESGGAGMGSRPQGYGKARKKRAGSMEIKRHNYPFAGVSCSWVTGVRFTVNNALRSAFHSSTSPQPHNDVV